MRIEFTSTARATIREFWACEVPYEVVMDGVDALRDYLDEQMGSPESDVVSAASDQVVGNEEDRAIEGVSLEDVYTRLAIEAARERDLDEAEGTDD